MRTEYSALKNHLIKIPLIFILRPVKGDVIFPPPWRADKGRYRAIRSSPLAGEGADGGGGHRVVACDSHTSSCQPWQRRIQVAGSCSHSDPNLHSPLLWGREAQPLGEGLTLYSASTGKDMGKAWPLRGEDGVKGYPNPVTALSAREKFAWADGLSVFLATAPRSPAALVTPPGLLVW
jgi:hypothetical protein